LGEALARLEVCGAEPELVALCKRCLAFRQEDRPADGQAVAAEVARVRQAAEERARRSAERRKRLRILLAASGAIALALLAGLGVSLWQMRRAMQAEAQAENRSDEVAAVNVTLRREKYIADMNLAHHAWEANNLVRTRQLLDQHLPRPGEPDLRGFEWHYLRRLFHGDLWTVSGHGGSVAQLAYTPDGRRLFSCGKVRQAQPMARSGAVPGEIKLWNAATGREVPLNLKGPTDKVVRIALSRDGGRMAAACGRDGIRVWDLDTGQAIDLPANPKEVCSDVSFSPDGARLVAMSRREDVAAELEDVAGVVRIWALAARKAIVTIDRLGTNFHGPAFSPDGKHLAVAFYLDRLVRVLDAATGREEFSFKCGEGFVSHVVFSPDGKSLATCGLGEGASIWDVATRQKRASCHSGAALGTCLAYSPDGKRLAMASIEGFIELWDAGSGQKTNSFKGGAGDVRFIAFSPDGTCLASAGSDGTIRVWETTRRHDAFPVFGEGKKKGMVDLSPDGQTVLTETVDDRRCHLVDAATGVVRGEPIPSLLGDYWWDWTADSKRLVGPGAGKTITIHDAGTGALLRTFQVDREPKCMTAFSPDGKWCAYSGPAGTIKILDAESGAERRSIAAFADPVHNLACGPDGSRLAGVDEKGWVKVWDTATGRETMAVQVRDMYIIRIRFSPDGKRLALVGNHGKYRSGEARILDLASGREMAPLRGHTILVTDVAFSPDGQRVATASSDRTVRVWDPITGQEILTLRGHTEGVCSVRFLSDGHRIASASRDLKMRVWDATPLPD
jgi:WD40 repeat protein